MFSVKGSFCGVEQYIDIFYIRSQTNENSENIMR